MKKKSKVYAKYKDSKHPAYVDIAKKTKSELQKARLSFEQKLAKNIKGDTNHFAYVRGKTKAWVLTGPLKGCRVICGVRDAGKVCREFGAGQKCGVTCKVRGAGRRSTLLVVR